MPKTVCKFGGSSLKDLPSLKKVLSIIEKDRGRRYIVVSAPGKRFVSDEKVTDLLIKAYGAAQRNDRNAFKRIFEKVRVRFDCFQVPLLNLELDHVERQLLNGASFAFAASRGEYLTAKLLSDVTGMPVLDPVQCLYIQNGNTKGKSYACIRRILTSERAIIPGFYGRGRMGIAVYPRGGGDITGGVIAKAVGADLYENWTDVSGVRACNPTILKKTKGIEKLSYAEIRKLFDVGASVLHGDAVIPLMKKNIPLLVANTFEEEGEKTLVCKSANDRKTIAGLAVKRCGERYALTAVDEKSGGAALKERLLQCAKRENIPVLKTGKTKISAFVQTPKQDIKRAVNAAYQAFFETEE